MSIILRVRLNSKLNHGELFSFAYGLDRWFRPPIVPTFSDFSGNMSVDFAQSSNHSYLGLLNDCGVPLNHVINSVRDDRDVEIELESSEELWRTSLSLNKNPCIF